MIDTWPIICDANTGEVIRTLTCRERGWIGAVIFSPDGKRLATGGNGFDEKDPKVRIWDIHAAKELVSFNAVATTALSFSPDGKQLAVASYRSNIATVHDAETGKRVRALRGHTGGVNTVAFSSDGKRLVTASKDKSIKVWDALTGQELLTLKGHESEVFSAVFSPDGRRILSTGAAGITKVWGLPLPSTDPLEYKAARLVQNLFHQHHRRVDVMQQLRADVTLDEAVREIALSIAQAYKDETNQAQDADVPNSGRAAAGPVREAK